MRLSPPTNASFIIAMILAISALLGTMTAIPFVSENTFWVLLAGFVVLALGVMLKDF